eukprot:2363247-Rhodomonas_salina.1
MHHHSGARTFRLCRASGGRMRPAAARASQPPLARGPRSCLQSQRPGPETYCPPPGLRARAHTHKRHTSAHLALLSSTGHVSIVTRNARLCNRKSAEKSALLAQGVPKLQHYRQKEQRSVSRIDRKSAETEAETCAAARKAEDGHPDALFLEAKSGGVRASQTCRHLGASKRKGGAEPSGKVPREDEARHGSKRVAELRAVGHDPHRRAVVNLARQPAPHSVSHPRETDATHARVWSSVSFPPADIVSVSLACFAPLSRDAFRLALSPPSFPGRGQRRVAQPAGLRRGLTTHGCRPCP